MVEGIAEGTSMSTSRAALKSIFGHALALSSALDRAAYLHEACAGDAGLGDADR
jgi:hypothetical protein